MQSIFSSEAEMGRSSKAQAEENRRRIVESAGEAFRAHGVRSVSIADIMTQAGMTQGGFYKHFESKDALAVEATTLAFGRAAQNWKGLGESGGRTFPDLDQLLDYYFASRAPSKSCPVISLAQDAEQLECSDAFDQSYRAGVEELFKIFTQVCERDRHPVNEERLMVAFASMVGANLLARATGDDAWKSNARKHISAIVQDANKE